MKRFVISLLFLLSGVSVLNAQIWSMPPEPAGVYRVFAPGGRTGMKESQPVTDYCLAGDQVHMVTVTFNGETGAFHGGERTWFIQPNADGGYNTYGPCGRTWTSSPNSAGTTTGVGPDGRTWTSWQTSTGSRVTYEQGGRTWVTTPNKNGGHTTYVPSGGAWISQPIATATQSRDSIDDGDAQRPSLPTPEYPLPVPAHSRPPAHKIPPPPRPMTSGSALRATIAVPQRAAKYDNGNGLLVWANSQSGALKSA
jgi:hypothetical protein